jgi:hypothetical protein
VLSWRLTHRGGGGQVHLISALLYINSIRTRESTPPHTRSYRTTEQLVLYPGAVELESKLVSANAKPSAVYPAK